MFGSWPDHDSKARFAELDWCTHVSDEARDGTSDKIVSVAYGIPNEEQRPLKDLVDPQTVYPSRLWKLGPQRCAQCTRTNTKGDSENEQGNKTSGEWMLRSAPGRTFVGRLFAEAAKMGL
jgi:hypothetical protein